MGKLTPDGDDLAEQVAETDLAAVGQATPGVVLTGSFNVTISGVFVGTIVLERSFDGQATWVATTSLGGAVAFAGPASETCQSREAGVWYRLRMTARTSGTARARLSQ